MQRSLRQWRTSTKDAATMSAKLEIVKVIKAGTNTSLTDSTNTAKNWWKEDFVTVPETDTDEIILTVSESKALIGQIQRLAAA